MPHLRVLAGPSLSPHDLQPVHVNSGVPVDVSSDAFEGRVAVYIKGFGDECGGTLGEKGIEECGRVTGKKYFAEREREGKGKGVTWSIQVQGRFLQPHSADDIMFGNVFDRALKLPWGFGAVLKFMKYIDPTLEHDLTSKSRPWALSPLIATMPHMQIHHRPNDEDWSQWPTFPPSKPITDDISDLQLHPHKKHPHPLHHHHLANEAHAHTKRKTHFQHSSARQQLTYTPQHLLTTDFCYDYLLFHSKDNGCGVTLKLPGGISIDMLRYWDGQPVKFVCCERKRTNGGGELKSGGGGEVPWGRVFWCVVIEMVDDEGEDEKADV
ncbi:DUF1769-domain-containing protein [Panus rudis PR-1116 ss-1]|nr:DUF1769-domain-containing protein [Panus rudis PR-1116 ss-1]